MKRKRLFIRTLLLFLFLFSLYGCNTNVDDSQAVDSTNVPSATSGQATLTYLGHSSVKIVTTDGIVIYIDPNYYDADYSDLADYIFITHGHSDHQPYSGLKRNDSCETITYKEALLGNYQLSVGSCFM